MIVTVLVERVDSPVGLRVRRNRDGKWLGPGGTWLDAPPEALIPLAPMFPPAPADAAGSVAAPVASAYADVQEIALDLPTGGDYAIFAHVVESGERLSLEVIDLTRPETTWTKIVKRTTRS